MPGHYGGPSISGSKPKPKPAPKPSSPSGYFGSMYTSPGQSGGPAGMTFTESVSNPNIGVTQQEAQQQQQQINNQDNNQDNNQEDSQIPETKVKKKKKKSIDVVKTIKDFYNEYKNFGGIMGLGLLPFKMIAEPTVETFQNPKALATLKLLFDEKGQKFKDEYLKDHGDLVNEAFKDDVLDKSDSFDFFDQQLEDSVRMSEEGILGAGSQKINFPAEFYTGEQGLNPYGAGGMPQTSGDLVNLASLAVTPEMQGTNPELVKMIFDARMELDRMGKDRSGNTQGGGQGGGGGIPSVATPVTPPPSGPTPPPQQPTLPPGITPPLNPSTRFPDSVIRDYTQLGLPQIYGNQQMPNYATFNRAGSMPVGLQNYLDALRNRFGIG